MTTTREAAMEYEAATTKNISELKKVFVDAELVEQEGTDKDGKPFSYLYIEVEEEKYRVPKSVLAQLKLLLEDNPAMTEYKVLRTGTTMTDTVYTVKEVK